MTPFLEYVQAGFSCIPIRADGSKAAAIPWKEFTARTPTEAECQHWQQRYTGVAIIGGAVSGNLEIVDLDEPTLVRPFIDALKSADATLPDRLTFIRTPRRNQSGQAGCHLYYRCEKLVDGNLKLALSEPEPDLDDQGKPRLHPVTGQPITRPRTLIETRGEGGYVLTVGCSGECHPSGRHYEHAYGPAIPELSVLSPDERQTILQVARMFDRSIAETHQDPPVRGYHQKGSGVSPGHAFNSRATWSEILEPHGWTCVGESAGIKRWRRPGKPSGISATTGILSKQGNELLTVFSTNAYPFEGVSANGRSGVTYSKFGAYAILNHAGDYQAAAEALLKLGYGTPAPKTERKSRVLKLTVRDAERRYLQALKAGKIRLLSTGLCDLDHALDGGVERGEMMVIGGLTSNGKSVLALQMLRTTAETGLHAVMVSHEMGELVVGKRSLLGRCDLAESAWKDHADELLDGIDDYWSSTGEIFLLHQCREIAAIETEIAKIAAEFDLAMIVIDHAQLTQAGGINRYEQLTNASARFKDLAVRHNCVVVVPSQLNRTAAQGEQGPHQLRESGALEQDADVVVLARWPHKQDQNEDPSRYVLKICKNRNRAILRFEIECLFEPCRQVIKPKAHKRHDEFERYSR